MNGDSWVTGPLQRMSKLHVASTDTGLSKRNSALGMSKKSRRRPRTTATEGDPLDSVSLAEIRAWAAQHPKDLQEYLNRNDSYVFFEAITTLPLGSLGVPVTGNRTLATDKRLFPRGAVVYVQGKLGGLQSGAALDHFMFDQDTGAAIRTAGRADVYIGVGEEAERVAGATRREGQLYYLFVEE